MQNVSQVVGTENLNIIYVNFRLHRVEAHALKTYGELSAFLISTSGDEQSGSRVDHFNPGQDKRLIGTKPLLSQISLLTAYFGTHKSRAGLCTQTKASLIPTCYIDLNRGRW
jgi:hypothetical protein